MNGSLGFWRAVFSLIGLAIVVWFAVHTFSVFIPFFLGFIIAYMVNPLVDRFVAAGWRRDRVVIVLYVLLLGVGALLGIFLVPTLIHEATTALRELPTYAARVNEMIEKANYQIKYLLQPYVGARVDTLSLSIHTHNWIGNLFTKLPENLLNVAHLSVWALIIPFSCFFALTQGKKWIDLLFEVTPSEHVERLLGFLAEINATLGGYIRGVLLEAMCVGLLCMGGLMLLGVDGAVLLGFLTGLLNLVPFMAVLIGGPLALLTGYLQHMSSGALLGIFLLYIGVRMVDDFVFIPFILGHNVKLHPVIMVFAILSGLKLGGFLGLVFAIPTAAVVKVIVSLVFLHRREELLNDSKHIFS